jgi:hypothetical protein
LDDMLKNATDEELKAQWFTATMIKKIRKQPFNSASPATSAIQDIAQQWDELLQTPSVVSKVDDALPTAWKMEDINVLKQRANQKARPDLFAEMWDVRAEKAYTNSNLSNSEVKELYKSWKLSKNDVEDLIKAREANAMDDFIDRKITTPVEKNQSLKNMISDWLPQKAKSLEQSDLTSSIKKAKAEGKTFEEFVESKLKHLHWTEAEFDVFDWKLSWTQSKTGAGKWHIFFTDSVEVANSYGSKVKKWYVELKNPLIVDAKDSPRNEIKYKWETWWENVNDIAIDAQKEWYDWVIFKNVKDTGGKSSKPAWFTSSTTTVVFDSSQVKTEAQLKSMRDKLDRK